MTTATTFYPVTTQTVAYTDTAAATSNAFGSQIYAVRIVATTDAHYALGASPTATTSDPYLAADSVEHISVKPGQKISFIRNSANGTAYVTEVSQ